MRNIYGYLFFAFLILIGLILLPFIARATNSHNLGSEALERQAWWADAGRGYVALACDAVAPGSGLVLSMKECGAYVREINAPSSVSIYVRQPAASVTFAAVDGTHYLYVDRSTSRAVSGFVRHFGTHYLSQQAAARPATPAGSLYIGNVTIASSNITAVDFSGVPSNPSGINSVLDSRYGVQGDCTTDDTSALQYAINATGDYGRLHFPQPLGACYLVSAPLLMRQGQTWFGDSLGSVGSENEGTTIQCTQTTGACIIGANASLGQRTSYRTISNLRMKCLNGCDAALDMSGSTYFTVENFTVHNYNASATDVGILIADAGGAAGSSSYFNKVKNGHVCVASIVGCASGNFTGIGVHLVGSTAPAQSGMNSNYFTDLTVKADLAFQFSGVDQTHNNVVVRNVNVETSPKGFLIERSREITFQDVRCENNSTYCFQFGANARNNYIIGGLFDGGNIIDNNANDEGQPNGYMASFTDAQVGIGPDNSTHRIFFKGRAIFARPILRNNQMMQAKNAAGTGQINIIRINASDRIEFGANIDAIKFVSKTFAELAGITGNTIVYCGDCTKNSVPCTGGGTGSFAKREANVFNCD